MIRQSHRVRLSLCPFLWPSRYGLRQPGPIPEDYDKAIEFFPESCGFYFWRASAYDEIGQYQNAINDYTKVIQFDPDEASLYLLRVIALQKLYKFSFANRDFNKACKLDKSNC